MRAIAQSRASATRRALWRTHSIALELIAVALLLLLFGAGLRLARQSPPPYDVDLTALEPQTPLQLIGFHAVERNEAFSYRWSSDYSFVQLPHGYNAASGYIASIRLRSGNPQGPQPLTFLANERALATVTPDATFRTY